MNQESESHKQSEAKADPPKRGRPRTADWRRLEDGRYDGRPKAKSEYFRIYAMNHACVKVVCPVCHKCVNKQELPLHQKRPICEKRRLKGEFVFQT